MSKKIYKETYFQHDRYARQDPKIKSMLVHFRKESEQKAQAAICIYWWIVEDMHTDDYPINKLDVFADDYRCDIDFLKSILEDFELFHKQDGCYVSNRVLRNLKEQEEKSEKARKSAEKRWGKKKGKTEEAPQENNEPEQEYNEELVMSIIQIYNKLFNKTQIVSNENKQRIFEIHSKNKLSIDTWNKVFANAKRGWDIGDKKNVPPNLKKILDEWDSFASDDYFLAPDREAAAKAAATAKEQEMLARQQEEEQYKAERANFVNNLGNRETAIDYLLPKLRIYRGKLQGVTGNTDILEKYNISEQELFKLKGGQIYD